jgi:hypothetical protein
LFEFQSHSKPVIKREIGEISNILVLQLIRSTCRKGHWPGAIMESGAVSAARGQTRKLRCKTKQRVSGIANRLNFAKTMAFWAAGRGLL